MPSDLNRPKGRKVAAAAMVMGLGLLTPALLARTAGTADGVSLTAPAGTAEQQLERATELCRDGKLVHARAIVGRLMSAEVAQTLSAEARTELVTLSRTIDQRLREADPIEVSLQKADLASQTGDLRSAYRHAQAVLNKAGAKREQSDRAAEVLRGLETRKDEIRPRIASIIEQATADFNSENFQAAKLALATVTRSGVELSVSQDTLVERYQLKLLEVERQRGEVFAVSEDSLGSLAQPGTVRRTGGGGETRPSEPAPRNDEPSGQMNEESAQAMNDEPAQPINDPAPAPSDGARPEPFQAEPPPAAQPGNDQPQDDLIEAALRAEAQRILAEADLAMQESRYGEAAQKYNLSVTANRRYLGEADVAHAEARLAEARARIGSVAGTDLAAREQEGISIRRQRAMAQFGNEMEQAQRALDAGDTARARDLIARARLTASGAREDFSEADYQDRFATPLDTLSRSVETESERIAREDLELRTTEQARATRSAEQNRRSERDRKINENLDRVRALQREKKYEEALQVVDQVLFLDPNNYAGQLLKEIIFDIRVYERYNDIQRIKIRNHTLQTLDNESAIVPPAGLVEYPMDWPSKSQARGELSAYAESPEDRRVLAELESRKIPVDFSDHKLEDVVKFLADVTSLAIDVDWDSLEQIGVNRETPVSMKFSQMPVRVVLDRVLQKASEDNLDRANWAVNDGILMIASDEELRRQTTLIIYNITDLLLEIPDFPDAPLIDLQSVLQQGEGGGGQSPFTQNNQQQQLTPDEIDQQRLDRIEQITTIIQEHVDYEGWRDNGGETGTIDELNGSLIIRNTPRNHREITGLLSKLREIRSMQINVETKFLLVNQDWFEQIGFDLDIVLNSDNNQVRAVRATQPNAQPSDFFDFQAGSLDRGLRRGTLPVDFNGDGDTDDAGEGGVGIPNPAGWSPIAAEQDTLGLAANLASDNGFASGILAGAPALGIAGQFLDDIQVDFLIQATQADRRSVQLTAPRLTFTNGQISNIFVVTQQAFISDLEPQTADSAVGFDPEVDVANEGVTLLVEGVISADRRYVTMTVDAGVSRIDGFAEEAVVAVAGGQLVNSAQAQSFIQLPTLTVTRVRTTVTVPDEGTILLGGQRLVTELEIETGVPVLSKLPILNRFFTNRIESKEEQTLLILMKPTILIQSEEEEKNFPGLNDSLRTGFGR
ncbi:MAG: hypothetical protein H7Y88_02425 [Phycisphaerales bacterium]|nr:hypothetical protein [Phycisphaerales bacterium]